PALKAAVGRRRVVRAQRVRAGDGSLPTDSPPPASLVLPARRLPRFQFAFPLVCLRLPVSRGLLALVDSNPARCTLRSRPLARCSFAVSSRPIRPAYKTPPSQTQSHLSARAVRDQKTVAGPRLQTYAASSLASSPALKQIPPALRRA